MKDFTLCYDRFKAREYELFKLINSCDEESLETNEKWQTIVDEVLKDEDYQRWAIKLVENEFGITNLNGIVTPGLMLLNLSCVKDEIMKELLCNVLFGYLGKDKNKKIMHLKAAGDYTYLDLILMAKNIKISEAYQARITDGVKDLINEEEFDVITIGSFLFDSKIDLRYKMVVIDKLDREGMLAFFYNEFIERAVDILSANLQMSLDGDMEDSGFDELFCDDKGDKNDNIMKIIEERINR